MRRCVHRLEASSGRGEQLGKRCRSRLGKAVGKAVTLFESLGEGKAVREGEGCRVEYSGGRQEGNGHPAEAHGSMEGAHGGMHD